MGSLFNLVIVVQVVSAIAIIGLVLLQHGKGADMGAAFGSGASGSLFGATGSSNFMSKSTGVAAAIFFSATLALSYITTHQTNNVSGGVMDKAVPAAPAAPAAAPATAPAAPAAPAASAPAPANSIPK
ncbi:preprotein translocase subunit SecG [Duganella sp. CF402]|uniref:preprotein translocase subunit SecG n=1 Tax=unclassified Duganella TaxID=2636909 RepID=UPI0008C02DB1|nr:MULTISPECIES: preprotein translocase subunit SecG [unclassified Duganella]RZT09490.1 protein translocase subunit secG [Duganella sp. BK701]SEL55301.1 preprotein translocase subunit SecG [Duganella sp. CF402]